MNKKTFIYIFSGVIAAGLIFLAAGLIVNFTVKANAVVAIVSLFALIAGGIMAGIGLISLLICVLLMVFSKGEKQQKVSDGEAEEITAEDGEVVANEDNSDVNDNKEE